MITYLQAIVIGLLQGVTELFPVSSLGHSVLVPAWLGWHQIVGQQSAAESPYLAFLVGLHVATALALLVFFRAQWVRIIRGLWRSLSRRKIETPDERLGWLLVVATIPAGLVGVAFEHALRTLFAEPLAASIFLTCNGVILLGGEGLRRRAARSEHLAARMDPDRLASVERRDGVSVSPSRTVPSRAAPSVQRRSRELATLGFGEALLIGAAQILAFFAGISRSGTTMVAGLARGLDHTGYFATRTLTPFAIYCLVAGLICVVRFA